jgi:hypothetical protein
MSVQIRTFDAAGRPAVTRAFRLGVGTLAMLAGLILLLVGCTDAPRVPVAGSDPSDPGARAPRVGYRSTIAPYNSQRPVEPGPWGEQNQRVAPQPKSAQ